MLAKRYPVVRSAGWLSLGLTLAACQVAGQDPPPWPAEFTGPAGPPLSIHLMPAVPVYGHALRLELQTVAPEGAFVRFYAGRGAPAEGACNGGVPGLCVSIAAPEVLGEARVDAAGRAVLRAPFGRRYEVGTLLRVQAVIGQPGFGAALSNLSLERVVRAEGDLDHDGLNNGDEALRGLRVWDPDSDDGGTEDAQEVIVDHTAPLDGVDDLPGERMCADGRDNDGDWELDCDDPDCLSQCPERGCADGADQDLDGLADCDDPDCAGLGALERCSDGGDDDCDQLVDCADPDCGGDFWCTERSCADGADDDLDGRIDCADGDCDHLPACLELDCEDGFDDDGNGKIDCADDDCWRPGLCAERACDDGRDDDRDQLVDCEDADCLHAQACFETDCADGRDEDGDAQVDCRDEDCWRLPACHTSVVAWTVAGQARLEEVTGARGAVHVDSVVGRVRVSGPYVGGVRTCTWTVDEASAALGGGPVARTKVKVGRDCRVDESALPPIGEDLWGAGWYGGWDEVTTSTSRVGGRTVTRRTATAGPALEGAPWGACEDGRALVEAWLDEDADGAGVAGLDRWGVPGGRTFFCGGVPEGYAQQAGDCDDLDPSWSPTLVELAPGASCLLVIDEDRDADGIYALLDPDDTDGLAR
jgi:hypothetical protein